MNKAKIWITIITIMFAMFPFNASAGVDDTYTETVFSDSFPASATLTDNWVLQPEKWSFIDYKISQDPTDDENYALDLETGAAGKTASGDGQMVYATTKAQTNTDYVATFRTMIYRETDGASTEWAGVYLRYASQSSFYALEWTRRHGSGKNEKKLVLVKNGYDTNTAGNVLAVAAVPTGYTELGGWNTFKVVFIGKNIKIYVNGSATPLFDYTDESMTLDNGYFGAFNRGGNGKHAHIYLDDLVIKNEPEITFRDLATYKLYEDDFSDTALSGEWRKTIDTASSGNTTYGIGSDGDNPCLDIGVAVNGPVGYRHNQRFEIGDNDWDDFVADMRIKVNQGSSGGNTEIASIILRCDSSGKGYALSWSRWTASTGGLGGWLNVTKTGPADIIPRPSGVLKNGTPSGFKQYDWNDYRFIVEGNKITIYVNDMVTPFYEFTDEDNTYTSGTIALYSDTSYANNVHIYVDDVSVYGLPRENGLKISDSSGVKVSTVSTGGITNAALDVAARIEVPEDYTQRSAVVVAAVYDGYRLIETKIFDETLFPNGLTELNRVRFLMPDEEKTYTVKVFLWEDTAGITPMVTNITRSATYSLN